MKFAQPKAVELRRMLATYQRTVDYLKDRIAAAETEESDERPHCGEPNGAKSCGSEDGLKRIIYMPNTLPESIRCREHFPKAWAHHDAVNAEPVHKK